MIILIPSNPVELSNFMSLEQHQDAAEFVTQNSLKEHLDAFFDPQISYLTITDKDELVGFILIALDEDKKSVELRRIVVAEKNSGVGQVVLMLLEDYVRKEIGRSRIWLDVFTNNERAIHIYQKLGYSQFGTAKYTDGRPLLLFEKEI